MKKLFLNNIIAFKFFIFLSLLTLFMYIEIVFNFISVETFSRVFFDFIFIFLLFTYGISVKKENSKYNLYPNKYLAIVIIFSTIIILGTIISFLTKFNLFYSFLFGIILGFSDKFALISIFKNSKNHLNIIKNKIKKVSSFVEFTLFFTFGYIVIQNQLLNFQIILGSLIGTFLVIGIRFFIVCIMLIPYDFSLKKKFIISYSGISTISIVVFLLLTIAETISCSIDIIQLTLHI